jgi:ABC-type glycerol-3-phosphate transport system permease component
MVDRRSLGPGLASNVILYAVITIIAVVVVFPVLAILSNSFKTYSAYMQNPVSLPARPVLESYAKARGKAERSQSTCGTRSSSSCRALRGSSSSAAWRHMALPGWRK